MSSAAEPDNDATNPTDITTKTTSSPIRVRPDSLATFTTSLPRIPGPSDEPVRLRCPNFRHLPTTATHRSAARATSMKGLPPRLPKRADRSPSHRRPSVPDEDPIAVNPFGIYASHFPPLAVLLKRGRASGLSCCRSRIRGVSRRSGTAAVRKPRTAAVEGRYGARSQSRHFDPLVQLPMLRPSTFPHPRVTCVRVDPDLCSAAVVGGRSRPPQAFP